MRGLGITLASLVVLAGVARADDTPLDQARHDVDSSDYDAARTHLKAALDAGSASPDELGEIYKLTGIVEAALGNTSAATGAFAKWVALEPKAALPPGTSPKITRPFEAAHKKAAKLELKTETHANPPSITLVAVSDPVGIVRARVIVSADGKPEEELEHDGTSRIAIALPAGKRLDLRVEALDAHGNRIAVLGSHDVPIVVTPSTEPVKEHHDHHDDRHVAKSPRPHDQVAPATPQVWYAKWKVWGIATAVAAVGTGFMAYETYSSIQDLDHLNATSLDHTFADARDAESSARRNLIITDVGAGLTGALAIGTAILYLRRPHGEELRMTAIPTRGGGGIAIGGAF